MKRTAPVTLLVLALVAGAGGYLVQRALAAASMVKIRPEYTLSFSLVIIAVLVVLLAVPIWQSTHAEVRRPVDPFRATRVVVFAKASAYLGAGLLGVSAGFLIEVLTRSVAAELDSVLRVAAMLAASALLLAAGLVAEHLCTVPPDSDDDRDGPAPAR
ncbi:DUF3180 domain-containing protein [uncultured Schumannella sp.]|uniref:DUF3180 domain-containing protein n=1 Tax=uncultured Schumannella sp. TaxID=1195956 RepID=UPI0025F8D800|nr:DUF3180 domain-containing protein [uncultured Schumannella sp.]